MQRNLDKETSACYTLMEENRKLVEKQIEMQNRGEMALAKPLTQELLEVELDAINQSTLDDFQEISLPYTPPVLEGCTNVFEEHFKVLESLENYLEAQQLVAGENEESGISTSPSIHEACANSLMRTHWMINGVFFFNLTERTAGCTGSANLSTPQRETLFAKLCCK